MGQRGCGTERITVGLATLLATTLVALASVGVSRVNAQDYAAAVADVVKSVDKSMAATDKKSVAVLELTDLGGRSSCLGQLLSEEVSVALVSTGRGYEIVSRNDAKLKAVLSEQRMGSSGLVDPQSAARVGQLIGVQALVMGTVNFLGDNVRVTISLVDATTARIVGGTAVTFPRTKAVDEYLVGCTTGAQPMADDSRKGAATRPSKLTTVQGVEFELEECARKGGAVACAVWVTNRREDRSFFVGSGVGVVGFRCWDNLGNEYSGNRIQVANRLMDPTGVKLIANLRTKTVFYIEGAVTGNSLSRLQLSVGMSDVGFFQVVLTDLPIH
jgi:TolB-like protein